MKYDCSLLGILNQSERGEEFHESQMKEVARYVGFGYLVQTDEHRKYLLTDKGRGQRDDLETLAEVLANPKYYIIDFDGTLG